MVVCGWVGGEGFLKGVVGGCCIWPELGGLSSCRCQAAAPQRMGRFSLPLAAAGPCSAAALARRWLPCPRPSGEAPPTSGDDCHIAGLHRAHHFSGAVGQQDHVNGACRGRTGKVSRWGQGGFGAGLFGRAPAGPGAGRLAGTPAWAHAAVCAQITARRARLGAAQRGSGARIAGQRSARARCAQVRGAHPRGRR